MQKPTAFQIVSIEPTQPLEQVVSEVAQRHSLQANFGVPKQFNAPVCGIEYHSQKFHLADKNGNVRTADSIERCLEEIESLTEQAMADGYLETL